eukprot:9398093-Alexandrium_andersonii.AAC.1
MLFLLLAPWHTAGAKPLRLRDQVGPAADGPRRAGPHHRSSLPRRPRPRAHDPPVCQDPDPH